MSVLQPVGMDSTTGLQKIAVPGDVLVSSRITGTTGTPTAVIGTGAGTTGSPTVSVNGTDLSGQITINTGTVLTPVGAATVATVSFNFTGYTSSPKCIILSAANSNASILSGSSSCFVNPTNISSTQFIITSGSTPLIGATTYIYYYLVIW